MNSSKSSKRQSGFTLVELLIVAIILAILAAIIVPQFASTTTDATESALRANVTGMRSAIDLYRQQHGEYPGVSDATSGTAACTGLGGTAGTGTGTPASEAQTLEDQLTLYSDRDGGTCSIAGTDFPFGPYIQDESLPTNPITDSGAVAISTAGDLNMADDGVPAGWKYDIVNGKFIVNDPSLDSQGDAYSTY